MVSGFNLVFHLLFVYIFLRKRKALFKGQEEREKKWKGREGKGREGKGKA